MVPPPREPWYRRLTASPRYMVLAIAGVLIVGGGAVFGIVQLTGDDEAGSAGQETQGTGGGASAGTQDGDRGGPRRAAVNPANVTVAVLNGTTVPGLAASIGDRVEQLGFQLGTVANGPDQGQQRAESVVMFTPGAKREAAVVSRKLGIPQREPADPASQGLAGNATVVVIAGADRTQ
ncbi:MAG: LytR C-terminal domain-containing protein [Thermoleophilaceae bacterium]|nr:LytR C-terminal domain-containing protein [Thermoleophilaceae bacterium]